MDNISQIKVYFKYEINFFIEHLNNLLKELNKNDYYQNIYFYQIIKEDFYNISNIIKANDEISFYHLFLVTIIDCFGEIFSSYWTCKIIDKEKLQNKIEILHNLQKQL